MAGEMIGPLTTLIGSGAGFAIGGPAGASMGAKIGSTVGSLGTMVSGIRKKKQSESMRPSEVDPNQVARLEEAKRKLKSMEVGTDAGTQANLSESRRLTESTKSDLAKVSGGNIQGVVDAMIKAQRAGGRTSNQAIGLGTRRADSFSRLVDQMAFRIEQRKREIQQDKSSQALAESAEALQTGGQNFLTGTFESLPTSGQGIDFSSLWNRKGSNTSLSGNLPSQGAPSMATPGINNDYMNYGKSDAAKSAISGM